VLTTEPSLEYVAASELERFGFRPYLSQYRRRWIAASGDVTTKLFPTLPRYLLLPINDASSRRLRLARGLSKGNPILSDERGQPRRVPGAVVEALALAEISGSFDEVLHVGDRVRVATTGALADVRALVQSADTRTMLTALLPLLGGCRARVPRDRVIAA